MAVLIASTLYQCSLAFVALFVLNTLLSSQGSSFLFVNASSHQSYTNVAWDTQSGSLDPLIVNTGDVIVFHYTAPMSIIQVNQFCDVLSTYDRNVGEEQVDLDMAHKVHILIRLHDSVSHIDITGSILGRRSLL